MSGQPAGHLADEPADTAGAVPVTGPGHAIVLTGTAHRSILTTGQPGLSDPTITAGGDGEGSSASAMHILLDRGNRKDEKLISFVPGSAMPAAGLRLREASRLAGAAARLQPGMDPMVTCCLA